MRIRITFDAVDHYDHEARVWVARSPELGVVAQGYSVEDAYKALEDVAAGYVRVCYENGNLNKMLKDEQNLLPGNENERDVDFITVTLDLVQGSA